MGPNAATGGKLLRWLGRGGKNSSRVKSSEDPSTWNPCKGRTDSTKLSFDFHISANHTYSRKLIFEKVKALVGPDLQPPH